MNPAPVLDLPQISIARYFDLLKRRRWQVIPVSLLGLLIGGVVAFFIPRYYVVETMIEYHRPPGDLNGRSVNPEDPFAPIVNNARYTLPLAAGATMKDLGWVEASEPDVSRLREIQRTVEQRIAITDVTPPKSQDYAQLLVSYRDRDGHRAANLLNTLVDKWRKVRLQDLQQRAEAQKREANNMVGDANSTYSQISANLEELSLKCGFQRSLAVELQRSAFAKRSWICATKRGGRRSWWQSLPGSTAKSLPSTHCAIARCRLLKSVMWTWRSDSQMDRRSGGM